MPIEMHIDRVKDLTVYTVTGKVSSFDIMKTMEAFVEERPTKNILWDFIKAMPDERITSGEVEKIAAFAKQHERLREGGKTALVASTDVVFGLARMYEAFASIEDIEDSVSVFRSADEAADWLSSEE